jgi:hypothetical protein
MRPKNNLIVPTGLILALLLLILSSCSHQPLPQELEKFASCLAEKGVQLYGHQSCSHCQNQKELFGPAWTKLNYIECSSNLKKCLDEGVEGYPIWKFADGSRLEGEQTFEALAQKSGCPEP